MKRRFARLWPIGLAVFGVSLAVPGVGSTQGIIFTFHGGGTLASGTKLVVLYQQPSTLSPVQVALSSGTGQGIVHTGPVKLTCVQLEPYTPEVSGGTRLVPGATLYASGKVAGAANRYVLIKARDAGVATSSIAARDSAAVRFTTSPGGGSQCGAGGLTLHPLKQGAFLSARCDQGVICT